LFEMSTNSPEGEIHELAAGEVRVSVDIAHGTRLASLVLGGRERIVGPPVPPDGSIRWGCFLMAPWPGRLADGRLSWEGRVLQLPRTHGRHAIHGLLHERVWTVTASTSTALTTEIELRPAGWPFDGRVRQTISAEPAGVLLEAEIEADEPMPAALGWHPWFDRGETDPHVKVAADEVLAVRGMIPTGARLPVAGRTDLRAGPPLGRRRLDHAYPVVRSPAVVTWPDLELRLEFEPPLTTVVVHTPARAFCVEPQTAWPNALGQRGERAREQGAIWLDGGQKLVARLHLREARRP
jgi:aldose 1-epimerase